MEGTTADYPAAHSMDTSWFSVDQQGHVGVFNTGENGHAPEGIHGLECGDAPYDLLDWYAPPASPGNPQWHHLPSVGPPYQNTVAELTRIGVFWYYYEVHDVALEWSPRTIYEVPFYAPYGLGYWSFNGPYIRAGVPATPLHVDQLPPGLRRRAKRFRLAGLSFAERELVQPVASFACTGWGGELHTAYLSDDGKTLRPNPGKEKEFGRFVREFLAADPRRAGWFVFDGPADEAHDPPG